MEKKPKAENLLPSQIPGFYDAFREANLATYKTKGNKPPTNEEIDAMFGNEPEALKIWAQVLKPKTE